jgi:hypothetical protein
MFCPSRALAKSPGQYGSTSFPDALITFESFSLYRKKELAKEELNTYGDVKSVVMKQKSGIRAAEFVMFSL